MALKSQMAGVTAITPSACLSCRSLARAQRGSWRDFPTQNNSSVSKLPDHIRLVCNKCQPLLVFNEMSTQHPHDGTFSWSSGLKIRRISHLINIESQTFYSPQQSIKHNWYFERWLKSLEIDFFNWFSFTCDSLQPIIVCVCLCFV